MFLFQASGDLSPYWTGVLGSLAVEVASAVKDCLAIEGRCPERYKKFPYLLFRTVLAFVSGALPVIMASPNPFNAFYLGASAPLILDRLAKGVKPTEPGM